ncbi:MAG: threonine--tRNA ligase [Planctomycetota bacterium]
MDGVAVVKVTLPDGSERQLEAGQTVLDLATLIGPGLAKVTVGAKLNGSKEIVDLRRPLQEDCSIEIVTCTSMEGLQVIRHSASHIMADVILQLWPDAKLSIGPSTADGFYYDIDLEHRFTDEDLTKIEAKMTEVVKANTPFEFCDVDRCETLERFRKSGEIYKVELIEGFDPAEPISLYRHGDGRFEDLCRGPHVPSTGYVKAWKLMTVAGAYWRGDEKRQMLQRIYGTAFNSRKELRVHLERLEEAKKRDHRKLGKELQLFAFNPAAPATPFFFDKGARIYNMLQDYVREKYQRYGYSEVITPIILNNDLWRQSGHWDKYKDNMFFTKVDDNDFAVKPMNCPCHCLMYGMHLHSYRDLPIRMADFGRLHRYERTGATGGLTRVRSFAQDDAHIFCTEDQIAEEISGVISMIKEIYSDFGFAEIKVYFSTRPEQSVGSDEVWKKAEAGLETALKANNIDFELNAGDGAFYGPKIDFVVLDALRREWQLGTCQLDFVMPERFELEYINPEGSKSRPVMVHRAVLGSIERFFGIIIEHFAGAFPIWLAPVQVSVATINDDCNAFGAEIADELTKRGFRVERQFENAKLGAKIRHSQMMKIPFTAVIGNREAEEKTLSIRERGGEDHGSLNIDEFCAMMRDRVDSKK